jgi:hypothetical protein
MKMIMPLALAAALAIMSGCGSRADSNATADSTATASNADRVAAIAGDKSMTADVMLQSHEHGTFDDALAIAMRDSSLAAEVMSVVKSDPRSAAMFDPSGTTHVAVTTHPQSRTVARAGTSRSSSGDVLDKTERTVQKANEKIDQAARIKQGADDARRKVEGILKP